MTTQEAMALAKEKIGKDITEQEAQDYLSGKTALPDEALDMVSGGCIFGTKKCPKCGSDKTMVDLMFKCHCSECGYGEF